ncbi:hypothetical protein NONO_c17810 [Nocardia nova SH22a]|uniref:Uncharacterized protein n=1 Tax=Nocardia nova SH22a TaxID=1415166 RepID=W5TH59_9NOCA|nr:hypothetical protein [Nocardia nova]AHH16581.1 hypothetical protein NONO_c17810 [Nocardia nova SH22a]
MAELKEYEVVINGWPTSVQLTEEDARARGLTDQAPSSAKSRTAANKSRTAANKSRTAANKGTESK